MGKIVVKRFPDDEVFGAGDRAIERWANNHNARVISQSVSKGWITVTFETLDQTPTGAEHTIYRGPSSTIIQTRHATDEELRSSLRAEIKSETEASQTRITRIHLEEPEEAQLTKPKKRWWGR